MTPVSSPPRITLLYFAALGEQLGVQEESLILPDGVTNVEALRRFLRERGQKWQALFGDSVRVAVNHEVVAAQAAVRQGDEVAFFPPVTGG